MLNFLIAYDNIDIGIGAYLHACFSDLENYLNQIVEKNVISMDGNECTEDQIEIHTNSFNGNRFIFVAFTHGRNDSLIASRTGYVNFTNVARFQNSFFYTCACLTAIELGPELERNGCLAYIGYNTEVKTALRFEAIFKKCKNAGIKFFLSGNKTVDDTYHHMIETYENEFENLSTQSPDSFLAAAFLRSNMTSLVCLGNKNLTLNDFSFP